MPVRVSPQAENTTNKQCRHVDGTVFKLNFFLLQASARFFARVTEITRTANVVAIRAGKASNASCVMINARSQIAADTVSALMESAFAPVDLRVMPANKVNKCDRSIKLLTLLSPPMGLPTVFRGATCIATSIIFNYLLQVHAALSENCP